MRARCQNQGRSDGPAMYSDGRMDVPRTSRDHARDNTRDNQSSHRATLHTLHTSSCMRLVQSIIYNLYKETMGFFVIRHCQELWMLQVVGSGFGMVSFQWAWERARGAH